VAGRQNSESAARAASPLADTTPPRLGRRERNKQEKLARIVAAARELFRDRGFAETTTQQIAEAADIGTGTLFLYARSKEDLLVMVFRDEMIETARAAFEQIGGEEPLIDQLVQVFASMQAYHGRDVALARILLKEVMFPDGPGRQADIAELLDVIYAGLAELISRARAAGRCDQQADPVRVAENLFANYYMDLLSWLGGRTSRDQFLSHLRRHLAITIGCQA
jgi:AcrR family transcriptional regulator